MQYDDITNIIVLGSVLVMVLTTVTKVIKQMSIFPGISAYAIAMCVTLLSITGMNRYLIPGNNDRNFIPEIILLPYAALGIIIVLIKLVRLFKKMKKYIQNRNLSKDTDTES